MASLRNPTEERTLTDVKPAVAALEPTAVDKGAMK
jgi:hypothetical protein